MSKIAVFVKNLTSGGAEKQAALLALNLAPHHDVTFVIFNGEKVHDKYIAMLGTDVKIKSFIGSRSERWKQFKSYLREQKFDIIFSYLTAANAYACVGAPRSTRVVTGLRNVKLPFAKHLADMLITDIYATATITNCRSGKKHFGRTGFRGKKIAVIPNCVDTILPYSPKMEKAGGRVDVITVGRFVAQKDYPTLIASFAKAASRCDALHLTIVGYGELESEIGSLIHHSGAADRIAIAINPRDIAERLSAADIYLSTSLFEGLSNSILEAMNADLPVVATNVGDNASLVKDGVNGFLAEKRDVDTIADSLCRLGSDKNLRDRMGQASKSLLESEFSAEKFTEQYNRLINQLLEKK